MIYAYQIFFERKNRSGEPLWVLFRCAVATLEELVASLNEGNLVIGESLFTKWGNDDEGKFNQVIGKMPTALGRLGITQICTPSHRIVEFVDE